MKRKSIRMMVEGGIMIGLAYVLSLIKVWQMPQGGSVTLASMVPIMVYAVRWGLDKGLLVGAVYGMVQFLLGVKYSFHIVSILFDYAIAFSMLGFAGIFRKKKYGFVFGAFIAVAGRFICHVISGAIVFFEYAGTQNPWIYSIIYNGTFLLPELIISIIVILLISKIKLMQVQNQ